MQMPLPIPFHSIALGFLAVAMLPLPSVRAESPAANASAAIIARIKAPAFAKRDFVITAPGAITGKDCTEAITKAVTACHEAGGGRVVVPEGVWLTGAVHLKSNVNLHLAEGATLRFSPEPAKYLPVVLTRFEGIE